jgi:hypothetical protein
MSQPIAPRSLSGEQFRIQVNGQRNTLIPLEQYKNTPNTLQLRTLGKNENIQGDYRDNLVIETNSGERVSVEADRLLLTNGVFNELQLPSAGAQVYLFDDEDSVVLSGRVVTSDKEDDLQTAKQKVLDSTRELALRTAEVNYAQQRAKHTEELLWGRPRK